MGAAEWQTELDTTGVVTLPGGNVPLDLPLFADAGTVRGGEVDAYHSGSAVVTSFPRGLVSDDHWAPGVGWRSRGDAYVMALGVEHDLGPHPASGPVGWGSVPRLRVRFHGTIHSGRWNVGDLGLCGLNDSDLGYTPSPAPWQLTTRNGSNRIWFSIRTADSVVRHWHAPYDPMAATLDVAFDLTLATGVCVCRVNGNAVAVDASGAGVGFGPNMRLMPNWHVPFGVLRLPPSGGWPAGYLFCPAPVPDVTVRDVQVWVGNSADDDPDMFVAARNPRRATYPGGPSLPLMELWSRNGSRHGLVVHESQANPPSGGQVLIDGLAVNCSVPNPVFLLGPSFGRRGVHLRGVTVTGGTRAVQGTGTFASYPMAFSNCLFEQSKDCGIWLYRCAEVNLDRVFIQYPRRCCLDTWGCGGAWYGLTMLAPPGVPQDSVIKQTGGDWVYERVLSNYEYLPAAGSFVDFTPWSPDGFPSAARVVDCGSREITVDVRVRKARTGYSFNAPARVNYQGMQRVRGKIQVDSGASVEASGAVDLTRG